jgi:hypothetical protein
MSAVVSSFESLCTLIAQGAINRYRTTIPLNWLAQRK